MGLLKPPFYCRRGPIRILSRNKILHQLGLDILEGLSQNDLYSLPNTIVIVGCHHSFNHRLIRLFSRKSTFVLGIQTEQFFDANEVPLWGTPATKNVTDKIFNNISFVDALLDLSKHNKKWYEELKLPIRELEKLHFGPFVFPTEERKIRETPNQKYVFFGNLNQRRRQILDDLGEKSIRVLPDGTYGDQLLDEIGKSRGVLNLHYSEGIYTEVPRLLTSYLAQKPIISERLAAPFEAGVHYIDVNNQQVSSDSEVYENFNRLATKHLSFATFLRAIVRNSPRRSSFFS